MSLAGAGTSGLSQARAMLTIVLPRLVAAAFGVAIGALALTNLVTQARYSSVIVLAGSLATGGQASEPTFAKLDVAVLAGAAQTTCHNDAVRAASILQLAALETVMLGADAQKAEARMGLAGSVVAHALSCIPLDADLWLRAAMVEASEHGRSDRLRAALDISYWSAPNEGWIIRQRIPFVANLYTGKGDDLEANLEMDIRKLATQDSVEQAAAILNILNPRARAVYDSVQPLIPSKRADAIAAAMTRLTTANATAAPVQAEVSPALFPPGLPKPPSVAPGASP